MRILKINNGFVTNSSSLSGELFVALKKGKDINDYLEGYLNKERNLGLLHGHLNVEGFEKLVPDSIQEENEYYHLKKGYDFYTCVICIFTSEGDDLGPYSMSDAERSHLMNFVGITKTIADGKNLIFLHYIEFNH